ncbi:MAG: orotidine-5'-phosphate decarboxylase, partial [Candidatus Sungbacteria bacterium]|nr:orotidine-5'-phosphate decarboxylase [Candidatus Sungbacteria bacterium]
MGLDTEREKLPRCMSKLMIQDSILTFNRRIIDATHDLVCAYKINSAFYEQHGIEGMRALMRTIEYIRQEAPEIPVILDAKRGDIGNSSAAYAKSAFDVYKADAVTVNPLLGRDAIQPFLDYANKGIFILCHTSNPDSNEFQDLVIEGSPLYQTIAEHVVNRWNTNNNCGLVVGATFPEQLFHVRQIARDMPILIPAIGTQGGNLEQTIHAGINSQKNGVIINVSRSVIFASQDDDFDQAARNETLRVHDQVNCY